MLITLVISLCRSGLNPRQQGGQADGGHVQIRVDPANKFDFDSEVDGLRSHVKKIKQVSFPGCRGLSLGQF